MGIGKSLTKILATSSIIGALAFGIPKNASAQVESYMNVAGNAEISLGTPISKILSVPDYMRTVPAHPDDGGWTLSPMDDGVNSFIPLLNAEGRIGGGIIKDNFNLNFGGSLGVDFAFGNMVESNYTNHPGTSERGYGAALTYYEVEEGGITLGAFVKASLSDKFYTEYCLGLSERGIFVANGWDRFDKLQQNQIYGSDFNTLDHTFRLGIKLIKSDIDPRAFGAFVGLKFSQILKESDTVKQMGLTAINPSVFAGFRFEYDSMQPSY
jgi:hypothetical protein